jgi:3-oxoacyl-[acyl-carrier-protein] synthase II
VSEYKTRVGSQIDDAALKSALERNNMATDDRPAELAMLASAQAIEQAGIISGAPPYQPQDVAVIFGTGAGSAQNLFTLCASFTQKGIRGVRPTTVPRCMLNSLTAQISIRFRLTGPNYVVVCACASASAAIGAAYRMIRDGHADKALCGGTDSLFDPAIFAAWNNLGVMSRNPNPEKACRPFDSARDGFIMGEGAGALLLESLESATQRNAKIRAEILGYGETSDASHITHPSVEGQAGAITSAMRSAGIAPADISFVNAHGTATKANDETESESVRMALGNAHASIPVSANKSYFGHTMGASGALETIASILCLEHQLLPPNLNIDNPDPKCNLCLVGDKPQEFSGRVCVKNSFGFGGNNSVLVIGLPGR